MGKHGKHEAEDEEITEVKCEHTNEMGIHTIHKSFDKDISETIAKVFDGSLRSGKRIEYEGSIILLGDINNGAEVIAEDNIIVLGTIRGLAHAGAKGNRKAIIVANEIDAPQLRIADIVKEMENSYIEESEEVEDDEYEEDEYYRNVKTRAYIKDNDIVVE